jgi:hypothetical protein
MIQTMQRKRKSMRCRLRIKRLFSHEVACCYPLRLPPLCTALAHSLTPLAPGYGAAVERKGQAPVAPRARDAQFAGDFGRR